MALRRLGRTRLYEEVVRRLLDYIRDAALAPGARLPTERELAEQLGVSRVSVRQATVALEVQDILTVRHGDGIYVVSTGELLTEMLEKRARLPDILEAREVLEVKLAEFAAERRTAEDINNMDTALKSMAADIAAGGIGATADSEFHGAVTRAARNVVLAELMRSLHEPIRETRVESLSEPGRPPRSLGAHWGIADGIRLRDPAAAGQAMRDHLRMVADVRLLRLPLEHRDDLANDSGKAAIHPRSEASSCGHPPEV